MISSTHFAVVQLCSTADVSANNAAIAEAVAEGAAHGAQIVCFPEAANLLLRDNLRYPAVCVPEADDTTLALCRSAARRAKVWVHTGSLLVRTEDGQHVWNRSHLVSPEGEVVARYDKLHTFDVELGGAGTFQESAAVRPGENGPTLVGIDALGLTLGMSICYDLRFPHLYRCLAQAGANVLLAPSSFSVVTGPLHWETLLKARAIETGSYVVAAAQCGERDGVRVYGHSRVISPFGEVIAAAGDTPAIIYADIDPERVRQTRVRLPSLTRGRTLGEIRHIHVPAAAPGALP